MPTDGSRSMNKPSICDRGSCYVGVRLVPQGKLKPTLLKAVPELAIAFLFLCE
jgi:hypothetical protein